MREHMPSKDGDQKNLFLGAQAQPKGVYPNACAPFTPWDFGAWGDGVHDDTRAIDAWIAACLEWAARGK